jgi:membrane-associated phospholipid phosphatase
VSTIQHGKSFLIIWLLFVLMACAVVLSVPKGDEVLWLNVHHRPYWDYFFKYATELGNGLFYVLIAVWLAWNRLGYGLLALVCFSVTGITVQIFKQIVFADMVRPKLFFQGIDLHFVEGVDVMSHYSFPSGHAATAFSMFLLLSLLMKNQRYGIMFCFIAIAAGFSRMYLAQHFLVDVVAGSVVGVAITLFIYQAWFQKGINNYPLLQKPLKDVF